MCVCMCACARASCPLSSRNSRPSNRPPVGLRCQRFFRTWKLCSFCNDSSPVGSARSGFPRPCRATQRVAVICRDCSFALPTPSRKPRRLMLCDRYRGWLCLKTTTEVRTLPRPIRGRVTLRRDFGTDPSPPSLLPSSPCGVRSPTTVKPSFEFTATCHDVSTASE